MLPMWFWVLKRKCRWYKLLELKILGPVWTLIIYDCDIRTDDSPHLFIFPLSLLYLVLFNFFVSFTYSWLCFTCQIIVTHDTRWDICWVVKSQFPLKTCGEATQQQQQQKWNIVKRNEPFFFTCFAFIYLLK